MYKIVKIPSNNFEDYVIANMLDKGRNHVEFYQSNPHSRVGLCGFSEWQAFQLSM